MDLVWLQMKASNRKYSSPEWKGKQRWNLKYVPVSVLTIIKQQILHHPDSNVEKIASFQPWCVTFHRLFSSMQLSYFNKKNLNWVMVGIFKNKTLLKIKICKTTTIVKNPRSKYI